MIQSEQDVQLLRAATLTAALDSVITIDERGLVVDWNPAAERTFGYTAAEARGRNLSALIVPPRYREAHERGRERYLQTGVPHVLNQRLELEALHKDGHTFPCELTVHAVSISTGTFFTAYLRDLSAQRHNERRLQRAAQRAAHLSAGMAAMARAITPAEVAQAILHEGLTMLDAHAGLVFVRQGDQLMPLSANGALGDALAQVGTIPLTADLPVADVLRTGEASLVSAAELAERYPEALLPQAYPGAAVVVMPLKTDLEVTGVLVFTFQEEPPNDPEDLQFLQHLADQCALTLQRVQAQVETRQMTERFQSLVTATTSIVWTRDGHAHFVEPQPQWAQFTGQTWEEYRGMGWVQAIHPDDRHIAQNACVKGVKERAPYQIEYRLRHHQGQYRVVRVNAVPVLEADGHIREWIGFHRDITQEREAQHRAATLHAMTARLSEAHTEEEAADLILHHARTGLGAYAGTVLRVRDGHFETVGSQGYAPSILEQFRTFPLDAHIPVADAVRTLRPLYLTGQELSAQYPLVARVLEHTHERLAAVPLVVGGHALGGLVLSFADEQAFTASDQEYITTFAHQCARALDHIQAYQAATDSEARLSGIISTVSDAVITTDEDRRILLFNAAAERVFAVPAAEVLGQTLDQFIPGAYRARHHDHMRAFGQTGVTSRSMHGARRALPALRGDGSEFLVEATISQVVVENQRLFTAVIRDVTTQLQAEQTLRESEERFRATFSQAAVGIAHVSLEGRWLSVNDKTCEIVGYPEEELLALSFQQITHPDDLELDILQVQRLLSGQIPTYTIQKRYLRKDRSEVWVNLTVSLVRTELGAPKYFISVLEDISAMKATEAELRAARQDLEQRVEERTAALQGISQQLQAQVQQLEQRNHETQILGEMSELLQASLNLEEAQAVVAGHTAQLFPRLPGTLYSFGPSKNVLEEMISWNGPVSQSPVFAPTDCWALRRGRAFVSEEGGHLRCRHLEEEGAALCVPLLAQGETVGLLHFHQMPAPPSAHQRRLAQTIAETVALAIVNLRLRETLRQQSIRDVLTGLFNRRYLEETFERELRRAQRNRQPIGVVMLDVDHFKKFNDLYGHEAGDLLLKSLGEVLQGSVRGEDVVCRYGGEEFALLLPGANAEQASARAEQIRNKVRVMQVISRGQVLGTVTASLGVAAYPVHGEQLMDLIRAADFALYRAKKEGRDRVVLAT
ncbi:PAS domain S-box protein [Deinococcus aquaedulcis]|uniref:PAS domain S-box protein n=1 Tax=Deinococcus aquaedulcis TaxID=2840455 RepID=UPI001C834F19|nr:PAS domain S-box protein [Deinococcus aquaedulcis]